MIGMDSVKLLMYWDVKPGKDQDYFEFVMREWSPGVAKLGLETTGAWYTYYTSNDDVPRYMAEGIAEDRQEMREILESDEWERLHDELMDYVENYSQKVVRVSGGFQF